MIHTFKNCNPETPMPAGTVQVEGVEWAHHMPPHGVDVREDGTWTVKCPWCQTDVHGKRSFMKADFSVAGKMRHKKRMDEMRKKGWKEFPFPPGVVDIATVKREDYIK